MVDYFTGKPEPILAETLTRFILEIKDEGDNISLRPEVLGEQLGWKYTEMEAYCRKGLLGKKNKAYVATPQG